MNEVKSVFILMYKAHTIRRSRRLIRKRLIGKGERDGPFRLGNKSAYRVQLLISISTVLIACLIAVVTIAVVTIDRTNTRCVLIPIVVSDNTNICGCSVSIQILVNVGVSLDWSIVVASPNQTNYRQQ